MTNFIDPPENIEISEPFLTVEEGSTPEKVLCTAEAYPQANYFWKFNGDTVATDNLLFFDKGIGRDQSGEYTCIAQNRHGASEIKTNFDVRCKHDRVETLARALFSILKLGASGSFLLEKLSKAQWIFSKIFVSLQNTKRSFHVSQK